LGVSSLNSSLNESTARETAVFYFFAGGQAARERVSLEGTAQEGERVIYEVKQKKYEANTKAVRRKHELMGTESFAAMPADGFGGRAKAGLRQGRCYNLYKTVHVCEE
jgi:hypothetical protein